MKSAVLFVSPFSRDANSLVEILDAVAMPVVHAPSLQEASSKLKTETFPVVLAESNLGDGTWVDLLRLTQALGVELVVTDAWADARFWAKVINLGAYDLLAQPFHGPEVRRVLSSAASQTGRGMTNAASGSTL